MPQDQSDPASLLRREVDRLRRDLAAPDTARLTDPDIRVRLDRIGDLFLDVTAACGPIAPAVLPSSPGAR